MDKENFFDLSAPSKPPDKEKSLDKGKSKAKGPFYTPKSLDVGMGDETTAKVEADPHNPFVKLQRDFPAFTGSSHLSAPVGGDPGYTDLLTVCVLFHAPDYFMTVNLAEKHRISEWDSSIQPRRVSKNHGRYLSLSVWYPEEARYRHSRGY